MPSTMKRPVSSPEAPALPHALLLAATAVIDVEAEGDGTTATTLPRFRMVAYTGGPMRIAGWRYPVVLDLAGLDIPSQSRPIRFGHDPLSGVGHTDTIRIDQGQLVATGVVSRDTAAAREVVVSSRNGFPWQASVGTSVEEFEFVKEGQKVMVNGTQHSGPVNVVRKATLGEISFVDLGADGATSATVAAAAVSDSQPAGESVSDAIVRLRGERARLDAIRRIATEASAHPGADLDVLQQLAVEAETTSMSPQEFELRVLRGMRPVAPAVHVHQQHRLSNRVLQAACVLTAGGDVSKIDDQTLDAATSRFPRGIGLQELLLEAAWANGYTGRHFRDSRGVLQAAFGRHGIEAAGASTINLGGILSNVANKFLLEGFFSVERTWRNICAVRNVNDFKTVTSYRLVGKDQYELVNPGGELKHGTLDQDIYTNRADTYGLILAIDRRDMINDDLGAITTVPRKLGRGSGLKINDVFWSVFLNNAAFFAAGFNNYLAGATTALSIDSLTTGEVTFMNQVDTDLKPIGVNPAILLVPTALAALGSQLYKSMELRDTTASTKFPVSNPHQGKFRVEVSRYLANTSYTGNSSKAWYLLAEPNDLPVIEVAFLNGQESPTIETAEADFNILGVQMRGYHDFGVALQDPRGGFKAKGEA